ncbi:hypothetical protein D3C76_622210 [compost metagenome]
MPSPEKKTIFISMVDATDEDMQALSDLMRSVPEIGEHYNGIITSTPVQVMDTRELLESMMKIHNYVEDGDPNNVGMTRTERFRLLTRHTVDFMEATLNEVRNLKDNMTDLAKSFNRHVHTNDPGGHNTAHHSITSVINGLEKMEQVYQRVMASGIKPKEGEMM